MGYMHQLQDFAAVVMQHRLLECSSARTVFWRKSALFCSIAVFVGHAPYKKTHKNLRYDNPKETVRNGRQLAHVC